MWVLDDQQEVEHVQRNVHADMKTFNYNEIMMEKGKLKWQLCVYWQYLARTIYMCVTDETTGSKLL